MSVAHRVFVIGASGMIGRMLVSRHPDWCKIGLGQPIAFDLAAFDPNAPLPDCFHTGDRVVFCAAMSKPGDCERNPEFCRKINVVSTGALIAKLLDLGVRVIFFSSDLVFNGTAESYGDEDSHAPVGVYGTSKSAIECRFFGHALFKVARLSYVVSHHDGFTAPLVEHALKREPFSVIDPLSRSAVYIEDLIEGIEAYVERFENIPFRVANFGGPALASRKDMAEAFRAAWGGDLVLTTERPDDSFYGLRPPRISLRTERFRGLLGRPLTPLDEMYRQIVSALPR